MSKFSAKDQILFAKQLSFLMKAGVPILESLQILQKQIKSKAVKQVFDQVILDVSSGQFLSSALAKFSGTFGEFAINIIRVGETGGILSENLDYLAEELKKKQQLKQKILSAMFYPAFIVIATLGLTATLTIFVFPKVLPIFTSVNLDLPISTKILIFVSHILINFGIYLVFLLMAGVVGFVLLMRKQPVKLFVEKFVLKIPLAGNISQNYYLANFCRTLGLLLKADSRLDEALITTAKTTENLLYRRELENIAAFVNRGGKISGYLETKARMFPDMLTHMVAIGEAAGNLSETFLYLGEMYEKEVDDQTKNLSTLIEPVLMLFMGLLVGFVAVSIITPIYSVTQKLHP